MISGNRGRSHLRSGIDSARDGHGGEVEEEYMTLERIIDMEIKNVYKEPLRHSELATKF